MLPVRLRQDAFKTFTNTTYGGFVDVDFWRSSIGFGYHHVKQATHANTTSEDNLLFVSYLFRLPVENLFVKAVYGYGRAPIEDLVGSTLTHYTNKMSSFRLRLGYDFR